MTRSEWLALFISVAIIAVFGLVATGCSNTQLMIRYHQSVGTAAILAGSCRDSLSEAHEQKTEAVEKKAKAGDVDGAKADREKWMSTYEKVKLACVALKGAAKTAFAAGPIIEASVNKEKEVLGWIARLANLTAVVTQALSEAGLKVPEVNP